MTIDGVYLIDSHISALPVAIPAGDRSLRQPRHALQRARVDRVAQRRDRLVAREGAAPRKHHATRRHRLGERHVGDVRLLVFGHAELRHHRDAHARGNHVLDRLQRRALEAVADAHALLVAGVVPDEARVLRADLEHMVAKAVAGAEQQHGFAFELVGADAFALGEPVQPGHRRLKRLVVERRDRQAGVGKRFGHDRAVELTVAQHLEQLGGEVFLQHQRHLRHVLDSLAHEVGQQVGADRVDHAQAQRAAHRVFTAFGDFLDRRGLLDDRLRLPHDLFAQRRDGDFVRTALEDFYVEFFFELFDRHAQRRLRDEARLGRAAEMVFAGDGDDVAEFGQGHGGILSAIQALR